MVNPADSISCRDQHTLKGMAEMALGFSARGRGHHSQDLFPDTFLTFLQEAEDFPPLRLKAL